MNSADQSGNRTGSSEFYFTTEGAVEVFDTSVPVNPYHSISGTHNGTITPNQTIEVAMLYTYSCPGTGGHSEYIITCSEFMDANGKRYDNWIPAIKLFRVEA